MVEIWDVQGTQDVRRMLSALNPSGVTCLIKPNFFTQREGYYTDAQTLDLFLGSIPGRKILIECYTSERTDGSRAVEAGQGREHLDWLLEQDRHFFDDSGIVRAGRPHHKRAASTLLLPIPNQLYGSARAGR